MTLAVFSGHVESRIKIDSGETLDFNNIIDALDLVATTNFTVGTGANQANEMFRDRRALAASSSENLDLAGVLTNSVGQTITFARIRGMFVRNNDTVTTLDVGGATINSWSTWLGANTFLTLRPNGFILLSAPGATGYTVTAGTGDTLKITRGSGTVTDNTYDLVLIGATA